MPIDFKYPCALSFITRQMSAGGVVYSLFLSLASLAVALGSPGSPSDKVLLFRWSRDTLPSQLCGTNFTSVLSQEHIVPRAYSPACVTLVCHGSEMKEYPILDLLVRSPNHKKTVNIQNTSSTECFHYSLCRRHVDSCERERW
jgi:hypothetical protein